MDEKKKVYVETSVISNLTARPSRSVIDMGHQVATNLYARADERGVNHGSDI